MAEALRLGRAPELGGRSRSREIEGRESRCIMTIMIMWEVPVEGSESGIGGESVWASCGLVSGSSDGSEARSCVAEAAVGRLCK